MFGAAAECDLLLGSGTVFGKDKVDRLLLVEHKALASVNLGVWGLFHARLKVDTAVLQVVGGVRHQVNHLSFVVVVHVLVAHLGLLWDLARGWA